MGYYTKYELEVDGDDYLLHAKAIANESGYCDPFADECKWYDHEANLLKYSKKHPTLTFRLSGEGEEIGDIWVKWFRNGQMQSWRAEINPPTSPPKE